MTALLIEMAEAESPSRDAVSQEAMRSILGGRLAALGFRVERLEGVEGCDHLRAELPVRAGEGSPHQLLLGHFDTERPTPAALVSLQALCDSIRQHQSIPRSQVFSHQDFKETECPGRFLQAWLEHYRGELAAAR